MKNKILPYTSITLMLFMLLFTACEGFDADKNSIVENDIVLQISAPEYSADWEEGTRSLNPLTDELQKQIHNLYFYFYDTDGYIEHIFHQNIISTSVHTVRFQEFAEAAAKRGVKWANPNGYLYVVANMDNMDNSLSEDAIKPQIILSNEDRPDYDEWRSTIAHISDFQRNAFMPLYISGRTNPNTPQPDKPGIGLPGHMIMFGSFKGSLHYNPETASSQDHTISMVLGRAVARLRIALSGEGLGKQARITIQNAPIVTALYPDMQQLYNDNDPKLDCWMSYMEMISVNDGSITGTDGNYSSSTFYYCGENSTQRFPIPTNAESGDDDNDGTKSGKIETTLIVETWDNYNARNTVSYDVNNPTADPTKGDAVDPVRTYTVKLGHDVPSSSSSSTAGTARDINLYRNTSYTFNVELKTGTRPTTKASGEPIYVDPSGKIHVWPEE